MSSLAGTIAVTLTLLNVPATGLTARVSFTNTGDTPALLWNRLAFADNRAPADVFLVTADGEKRMFKGPIMKLRPPGPDDYLIIPPLGSVVSAAALSRSYAIPDHGTISVQYMAYNQAPDGSWIQKLVSEAVSITLR